MGAISFQKLLWMLLGWLVWLSWTFPHLTTYTQTQTLFGTKNELREVESIRRHLTGCAFFFSEGELGHWALMTAQASWGPGLQPPATSLAWPMLSGPQWRPAEAGVVLLSAGGGQPGGGEHTKMLLLCHSVPVNQTPGFPKCFVIR